MQPTLESSPVHEQEHTQETSGDEKHRSSFFQSRGSFGILRRFSTRSAQQVDEGSTNLDSQVHNGLNSEHSSSHNALLTRRKRYARNKIPIISLDKPLSAQNSKDISSHTETSLSPTDASRSGSYPFSPNQNTRPSSDVLSTLPLTNVLRSSSSLTTRALSGSPSRDRMSVFYQTSFRNSVSPAGSKDSIRQSGYGTVLSTQASGTGSSAHSPVGSIYEKSGIIMSQSDKNPVIDESQNMAVPPGSLVQQRSTESHESSASMPSASSSGSAGTGLRAKSARMGFKNKVFGKSMDVNDNFPTLEENTPIQRRLSYEMATGKLDPPQEEEKHSSWKTAFKRLKDKSDALFKKHLKNLEETEPNDPVYHLLRCASNPNHWPETCQCICHMRDRVGDQGVAGMTGSIDVLLSPKGRPRGIPEHRERSDHRKIRSSPHSLHSYDDSSPLHDSRSAHPTKSQGFHLGHLRRRKK
ncbi:unnamed protein product [Calicophoron daubneyi]|uniref:Uncharacterized protein n=1 Tax=Calicophoron daubneyi TaxID=300641 RepID=A0AAV2TAY5_CALDB